MDVVPPAPARTATAGMTLRSGGTAMFHAFPAFLVYIALWEIASGQVFAFDATSENLPGPSQSAHRSLRMDLPRVADELDLPRRSRRASHQGWETLTRHFAVFSTTGPEQATWAAEQLEQAWHDVGLLADRWTNVHRGEGFGAGAVSVLLVDDSRNPRAGPTWVSPNTSDSTNIYLKIDDHERASHPLKWQIRREASRAFLRVAQQDLVLPDWVQAGLAAYISGEPLPWGQVASLRPPETPKHRGNGPTIRRPTPDRVTRPAVDRVQAAFWVRYLIVGNDGRHAPRFFESLAAAVAEVPDPWTGESPRHRLSLVDRLPQAASIQEGVADWLADPEVGQPVIRPRPDTMTLDERHRRMVLILKLARRFEIPPAHVVRPKVHAFSTGRSERKEVSAPAPKEDAPPSAAALYRRLLELPRWASIDTDGSLLWSNDKERLAEVFGVSNPNVEYYTYREDGRTVLEAHDTDRGEILKAWLEENPENSKRPIAHIELASNRGAGRGSPW